MQQLVPLPAHVVAVDVDRLHQPQQQLADRVGVTQSMVSQLENGDYEGSALDMLWRVCKVLRKELEFSFREPGSRRKRRGAAVTSA